MKKVIISLLPEIVGSFFGIILLGFGFVILSFAIGVTQSESFGKAVASGTGTQLIAALATASVALLAAFIAYQQWVTARNKLKLDLFEKRLQVYNAARSAIGDLITTEKPKSEVEWQYLNGIRGVKWLFDDRMVKYLDDELWGKIVDLGCVDSELKGVPLREQSSEKMRERADIKKYLTRQLSEIDERFKPFLSLRH
jgi:hypothetical protein